MTDIRIDIVFVILHFKTYVDTIECVESITGKIDTNQYHIIIVDNASNNGSLEKLKNKFSQKKVVSIVSNDENLGFAKGLNVGICLAREKFNPRYIAVINNDVLLLSDDLVSRLDAKMNEYNFSLCGPMIITKDGRCDTNPIRDTIRNKGEVEQSIKRYKKIIKICELGLYGVYKRLKISKSRHGEICYLDDKINYKLHGSFWIFSQKYFETFHGLDESTFLYGEEDILYLHLMKNKLSTLYTPDIRIFHKEDSSTNEMLPSDSQKMLFTSRNCIDSLEIYLKIFDEYERNSCGE